MLSFISSNKFTRAKYGKPLRKHLLKYHLIEYNDYTGKDVFVDASVDPIVIIIKKEIYTSSFTVKVNNIFQLHQSRFNEDSWSFNNPEILDLRDKINNKDTQIKNIENVKIYRSVLTGFNEAFIIPKKIKDKLIQEAPKNKEIIKPILRGRDIKKWTINYQNLYLIWTYIGVSIEDYPLIKKHLESY